MHGEQRHPWFEWVVLGFGDFVVGEQIGDAGVIQRLGHPGADPGGAVHHGDVPQFAAVLVPFANAAGDKAGFVIGVAEFTHDGQGAVDAAALGFDQG